MIDLDNGEQQSTSKLPEKPLKKWRQKFETGSLVPQDLMRYFQFTAPRFLSVEEISGNSGMAKCSFDDQGVKNTIIVALEEFIYGDDPEMVLPKTHDGGSGSTTCARIFAKNEAHYTCRDCAIDQTCVLCESCFNQSAHRYHTYKMNIGFGGGCCDCGDKEAWKNDYCCDEHKRNQEVLQHDFITETMRDRCRIVFDAILNYCMRSLKIEANGSIKNKDTDTSDKFGYCTVLYNNGQYPFALLENRLMQIAGWAQKYASECISTMKHEGRAIVMCSTFASCNRLKNDIDNQTLRRSFVIPSLLHTSVLPKNDVAYQQLSLQLLAWFQEFLKRHHIFRYLFCQILKQNTSQSNNSMLSEILINNCLLWRAASTSWHHLLMTGMLKEQENKKMLAIEFMQHYVQIMQDFIYHSVHHIPLSIVGMAIQWFTVPSIAQHLIASEDAFYKMIDTFYSISIKKHVKKNVMQFKGSYGDGPIWRQNSILRHIKFILATSKSTIYTDELRSNFLRGVGILIKLLREMQGMDSVVRQTDPPIRYEPQWAHAFNLEKRLAPVTQSVLDWCSSDSIVINNIYRMVMNALIETDFIVSQTTTKIQELAGHSASCMMYDVGAQSVSFHIPLSRFFAALYLHREKFNAHQETEIDTVPTKKLKLDQSIQPTPEQIIEPVLCTLTMVAQGHSGMWLQNYTTLSDQLFQYRSKGFRGAMLDRDIIALQICASLIESNEFLIHVINKFNLIDWISSDYEQTLEGDERSSVVNMIVELLELIIIIVGERHVPGVGMVTEEDRIKKEIIQYLCIKPYSLSELSETLTDCENKEKIKDILDNIAALEDPTKSNEASVYELKPQYFDDYNPYFYHYTKEEKTNSEKEQRKRRHANKELVYCPPPKLPQLTPSFRMLTNLLQCDVMLLIMQTVLMRASSISENHLEKVLYLIGYAVQEQESGWYPFFTFHERAIKWDILSLMENLISGPRVEANRNLCTYGLVWTVRRYRTLQQSVNHRLESNENVPSTL